MESMDCAFLNGPSLDFKQKVLELARCRQAAQSRFRSTRSKHRVRAGSSKATRLRGPSTR